MNCVEKNKIFLDYQYMLGNNKQIFIKELAFIRSEETFVPQVYYFLPPYSWHDLDNDRREHLNFCEKYINRLSWLDGEDDYINLSYLIRDLNDDESIESIFVKSTEKFNFLINYIPVKIKLFHMPKSFNKYPLQKFSCKLHDSNFNRCSINHVLQMLSLYNKKIAKE